jgi:hypothetical protein
VRRELLVRSQDASEAVRALDVAARADLGWADRWGVLHQYVLGRVPLLVVLDNFEDNLRSDGDAGYAVRDKVLEACWPRGWLIRAQPAARHLPLPVHPARRRRAGAVVPAAGALSRAETMKLAWSLPALDKLDQQQLNRVWRLDGGHPRSLEYLDALLTGGTARYPDVTTRLHQAISRHLDGADEERWLADRTGLDTAVAQTVALAADDVLLGDLARRPRSPARWTCCWA